jgi:hypothetical protein
VTRQTFVPVMLSASTVVCTQIGVVSPPTTAVSNPCRASSPDRSLDRTALNVVLGTSTSPSSTIPS